MMNLGPGNSVQITNDQILERNRVHCSLYFAYIDYITVFSVDFTSHKSSFQWSPSKCFTSVWNWFTYSHVRHVWKLLSRFVDSIWLAWFPNWSTSLTAIAWSASHIASSVVTISSVWIVFWMTQGEIEIKSILDYSNLKQVVYISVNLPH